MNLQYITDNQGKPTSVVIPISDWDLLINKYKDLKDNFSTVPVWHKEIVRKRLIEYNNNPTIALDFDTEIEKNENEL